MPPTSIPLSGFSTLATPGAFSDFYELLSVPKDASTAEIKTAYHRALLLFHPDKTNTASRDAHPRESATEISISLIKEAYLTLSAPDLRAQYDASRRRAPSGPRPAQVVSLEEFEEEAGGGGGGDGDDAWRYKCRCGGIYRITSSEMEKGHHLVGCNSCSEAVWVGYELQEEDEEDDGTSL